MGSHIPNVKDAHCLLHLLTEDRVTRGSVPLGELGGGSMDIYMQPVLLTSIKVGWGLELSLPEAASDVRLTKSPGWVGVTVDTMFISCDLTRLVI